jgi:DNA-directed RNA polymerase subunit RPC12/RpoP
MDWNLIACVVFAVFTVCALAAILLLARPRCPECGSRKIGIISKEPQGMRDVGYSGGGIGGGYSSAQILYNVKYRCSACEAQWTSTITETR